MSTYPARSTSNNSVFNPSDYTSAYANITYFTGDTRYLKTSNTSVSGMLSNIANLQTSNTTIFSLLGSSGSGNLIAVNDLQNANVNTYNIFSNLSSNISNLNVSNATINTNLTALFNGNNTTNTNLTALINSNATINTNLTALQNSNATTNTNVTALQNSNATINTRITALQNSNTTINTSVSALQTSTSFITASTLTGNTTVSSNVVISGNLTAGGNYFSVANGCVMVGTINPTGAGMSCPLLVQTNATSNNPWLNGICAYGNLSANAVITSSVQNSSGFHCWFALANRFGNSWVIANDNGTNSGNPLRFQASPDFSNVNANQMSLTRNGNLWVNRAIGIGNASPTAPLYVTAGVSGTDPSTNGIYLYNHNLLSGNNAIITARTNGASAGSPMISLDINNVGGWSILNDNSQGSCLNFNSSWNGSGVNQMTILRTTGNVGIASTNPAHKLAVYGTMGVFPTNSTGTERFRFYTDATGTADIIQIRQTIGSSATYWYYNGNNVAGTVSDRRVKTNIANLNIDESVTFIKNLTPRKFNYKNNPDGEAVVGFIAQEVLSSCVNLEQKSTIANYETYSETDPDCRTLGLNWNQLMPMLVQTTQTLLNKIETLESRIVDLEQH